MSESCACGSGNQYSECCGKYHTGNALPQTAEALMRSRYCAYIKSNITYLLKTWHPDTRPARSTLKNLDQIDWLGLKIMACEAGQINDETGTVEFVATCSQQGRLNQFHEVSHFVKSRGRWFYLEGEIKH